MNCRHKQKEARVNRCRPEVEARSNPLVVSKFVGTNIYHAPIVVRTDRALGHRD